MRQSRCICLPLAGSALFAHPPDTATIQGQVTGQSRAAIADAQLKDVALAGGATAEIDIRGNVAGRKAAVTVTGTVGEVQPGAPQIGTLLGGRQIEDLPLLSRRISNLPMLNAAHRPAINQGDVFLNQTMFTTNGAGRRQALYVNNGATSNENWGRQKLFSTGPITAVQEMNALAAIADSGRATGRGFPVSVVLNSSRPFVCNSDRSTINRPS